MPVVKIPKKEAKAEVYIWHIFFHRVRYNFDKHV